jgi:hypothetical protein
MSHPIVFPLVIAASLIVAGTLTGCAAAVVPGANPGGSSAGAASSSPGSAGTKCVAAGSTIPAGTYSGEIKSTLNTEMHLSLPGGVSAPNAGSGTEAMDGSVHIVSNGRTVTGLISLTGEGTSEVGGIVHSKDVGDFSGQISGPANNPIVTGKMGGAWQTLDAPVQSGGSDSSATTVGLHVTSASCGAVSGDAIAMFSEIAKPVEEYITVSGTGVWTANRR